MLKQAKYSYERWGQCKIKMQPEYVSFNLIQPSEVARSLLPIIPPWSSMWMKRKSHNMRTVRWCLKDHSYKRDSQYLLCEGHHHQIKNTHLIEKKCLKVVFACEKFGSRTGNHSSEKMINHQRAAWEKKNNNVKEKRLRYTELTWYPVQLGWLCLTSSTFFTGKDEALPKLQVPKNRKTFLPCLPELWGNGTQHN